jgi:hypothetical protein
MDNNSTLLLNKIQWLREQLNKKAISRNLIDPEIIALSQSLDILLVEYQKKISRQELT